MNLLLWVISDGIEIEKLDFKYVKIYYIYLV